MTSVECDKCGNAVTAEAAFCGRCGAPLPERSRSRLLLLSGILMLAVLLTSGAYILRGEPSNWLNRDSHSPDTGIPSATGGELRVEAQEGAVSEVEEIAVGKPTNASSVWSYGLDYSFQPRAVVDRRTNELHCSKGVEEGNSYWLLADKEVGWVEVDLEQYYLITQVRWLNTHNGACRDRATQRFSIALSRSGRFSGEEDLVYSGTMDFSASPDYQEYLLPLPITARYVRFYVEDYYGEGGGLNELEVYAEIPPDESDK